MLPLLNIADYAQAARAKLTKKVCDYIEGGALDEITLRENTTSWERLKLYYHVLAGVGTRERDIRNSFTLPDGLAVENLAPLGKGSMPRVSGSGLAAYVRDNFKSDLSFDDLDWLCGCTRLPVVVKGVCRRDDARRAAEH